MCQSDATHSRMARQKKMRDGHDSVRDVGCGHHNYMMPVDVLCCFGCARVFTLGCALADNNKIKSERHEKNKTNICIYAVLL